MKSSINKIEIGKCNYEMMLEDISPDYSREAWVRVGRAIYDASKGEDYGLAVFYQWSRRGKKHKRFHEIEGVWLSFHFGKKMPCPVGMLGLMAAEALGVELEEYEQILQQRRSMERKDEESICAPWHVEKSSQLPVTKKVENCYSATNELKPCDSSIEIEFDGCWVTIKPECDARGVDCNECPVQPGWENLTMIRW